MYKSACANEGVSVRQLVIVNHRLMLITVIQLVLADVTFFAHGLVTFSWVSVNYITLIYLT